MSLMRLLTSGKTLIGLQDTRPHYRMADPRSLPVFGSPKSPFRKKAEAARAEAKDLAEKISAAGMCQPELQSPNNLEEVRPDRESDGIRRCDGPLNPSLSLSAAQSEVTRGTEGERENFQGQGKREKGGGRGKKAEIGKGPSRTGQSRNGNEGLQDNSTTGQRDNGTTGQRPEQRPLSPAPSPLQGAREKTGQAQGPARAGFSWFSEMAERVGSLLPMRPRPARSAARAIAPQQGELALSLDQVKVVRNDLSDCDLEFVAKKQKAERSEPDRPMQKLTNENGETGAVEAQEQISSGEMTVGESGAFGAAWGRATRVFGAAFVRATSTDLVEKT